MSVIKPEGDMYALYAERVLRNFKYYLKVSPSPCKILGQCVISIKAYNLSTYLHNLQHMASILFTVM